MSSNKAIDILGDINRRTLIGHDASQSLPAITLADGTKIQTGTIGTLIQNMKFYDDLCAGGAIAGLSKASLEEMMTAAIPTLKKSGLLDVFPPEEWVSGGSMSSGRQFVGRKAQDMGY